MNELDAQRREIGLRRLPSGNTDEVGAAAHLDPGVAQFDRCRFTDNIALVDPEVTGAGQSNRVALGPAVALGTDTLEPGYSYPATAWLRDCSFRNNTMQRVGGLRATDVAVATANIFVFRSGTHTLRVYSAADGELLRSAKFGEFEEYSDGGESLYRDAGYDYDQDNFSERQTADRFWDLVPSGHDAGFKQLWKVCSFHRLQHCPD